MIRAGDLDRQIQIVRGTPGAANELNETTLTWDVYATLQARFIQSSGREFFAAADIMLEQRAVFRIRYRTDLLPTDRIRFNGLDWLIAGISEVGRREGLDLQAYWKG